MKFFSKRLWVNIASKLLILIGLVVACVVVWQQVYSQKIAMYQVQKSLNDLPERISGEASLKSDLERHKHDIARLQAYTPTKEGLSEFVASVEKEAARQNVKITINDFTEDKKTDESGKPINATGPIRDVEVQGVATGRSENLVALLFAFEHLPYLVRLSEWSLHANSTGTGTSITSIIPLDSSSPKKDNQIDESGQLFFTLVIAVRYE